MRRIAAIFIVLSVTLSVVVAQEIRPRRAAIKPKQPVRLIAEPVDHSGRRSLGVMSLAADEQVRVTVKFAEGTRTRILDDWTIYSLTDSNLTEANQIIADHNPLSVRRMSYKSPEAVDSQWNARMKKIEGRKGAEMLADLNTYFYVMVEGLQNGESLINSLNTLSIVEIAYREPLNPPRGAAVDFPPTTPNFDTSSRWLLPAPYGMDGAYAHTVPGGDGSGVQLIHVEKGWLMNIGTDSAHEDVPLDSSMLLNYDDTASEEKSWCFWSSGKTYDVHAMAIAGAIYAQDNGYGITGMAPGVTYRCQPNMLASDPMWACNGFSLNGAYEHAIDSANAGDVITTSYYSVTSYPTRTDSLDFYPMMILRYPGCDPDCDTIRLYYSGGQWHPAAQFGYLPTEYQQAAYDIIAGAWADTVIFVQLAGNGWIDISDTAWYDSLFIKEYRNSHSVLVGMGWAGLNWTDPFTDDIYPLNSRVFRSNYSSEDRVNLFAHSPQIGTTADWEITEMWVGSELAEDTDSGRHYMQIPGLPFGGDSTNGWDNKQYYTRGFDGTSLSTPLIAAAIACFQGAWKAAHNDSVLTADSIVAIFQATGTPEQPDDSAHTWGIGYMPDLRAAFRAAGLGPKRRISNMDLKGVTIE